jgi:hypothetical protein
MAAVVLRRRSRTQRLLRFPAHALQLHRLGFLPWTTCVTIAWQVVTF